MANEDMLAFVENERKNRKDYSLAYEELYARQKELQSQIAQQQAMIHQQERELRLQLPALWSNGEVEIRHGSCHGGYAILDTGSERQVTCPLLSPHVKDHRWRS
ncbi:hypothetical protein [Stutzerimonas nitrititolerans]|uniref:hypothetical protein n=1 Tax=Stutzerimonas nitrititolerans TaxID=2482751 RepID=UPI0028AADEFC|nr:hypothetical protein [Stutzerimonas nitrititolerans]